MLKARGGKSISMPSGEAGTVILFTLKVPLLLMSEHDISIVVLCGIIYTQCIFPSPRFSSQHHCTKRRAHNS